MKYLLLIHQGAAPTPYSPDGWARQSEDEQNAVYTAHQSINDGWRSSVPAHPAELVELDVPSTQDADHR